MPSAAHAYRYDAYAQAEPLRQPRTRVRVLHERRREPGIAPFVVTMSKAIVALLIMGAVVCCVSLTFNAGAIASTMSQADIAEQADQIESENAQLQIQLATLSAPSYVKDRATGLGMHEPESSESIELSEDSVVYNGDGTLSLSGSLAQESSD